MGLLGIILIIMIAFIFCKHKTRINFRTVGGSFLLLILLSLCFIWSNAGANVINSIAYGVNLVLQQGQAGTEFLFGAIPNHEAVLAFIILINVIFLGALFSLLYYLRIIQPINNFLGFILRKLLNISKSESLCTTTNLFMGPGDVQIAIRPYLSNLTDSQKFTVMVSCLSAVAGSVMGGYISMGMEAKYIITAVFMIMPCSIFIAKLMYPETEVVDEAAISAAAKKYTEENSKNIIDSIATGAYSGLKTAASIAIMLIAFLGLLHLLDLILGSIGGLFNMPNLSVATIFGKLLSPIAYVMGVSKPDLVVAGQMLAEKTFLNEFVAFAHLKENMDVITPKTQIIMTFAICGFANIGTVGIFMGAAQALFPNEVAEYAKFAFRALLAATLVNLLNGTIAGLIYDLQHMFVS